MAEANIGTNTGPNPGPSVTVLLQAWSNGDREALDKLTPVVYQELRRLARHYMRGERSGHTLQTQRWSTRHTYGSWT